MKQRKMEGGRETKKKKKRKRKYERIIKVKINRRRPRLSSTPQGS
jgi:hypothetical protein